MLPSNDMCMLYSGEINIALGDIMILLGLRELCSKVWSLFYSEFLKNSLHYACYYSFYAPHYYHYSIILYQ